MDLLLPTVTRLEEVFGISARVDSPSYVDRGRLDERFRRALASNRHIAVHGGSKQGKSWLRIKGLSADEAIVVQCELSSTPTSLLKDALGRLGVRAELRTTKSRELEGSLDFRTGVEAGKLLAKIKGEVGGELECTQGTETAYEPIGQAPGNLAWVSSTIVKSSKRLVLEDFHYISEPVQKELAFLLKAMGEYGLFVIVVGVWPKDHLLTYYNGDLEGRVEDIHLKWDNEELREVLARGAEALRVEFADRVLDDLVAEASGNVGLVQRLAYQLCLAEEIAEQVSTWRPKRSIDFGPSMGAAKRAVAEEMQGRFQTFADNFVRGMRRLPEGLEVYRHLLQAATDATDEELTEGVDSALLLTRIAAHGGGDIRASDLTQALDRIDRLQAKIDVRPPVLTYSRSGRKLALADRAFLFFRRNGSPRWPWMPGEAEFTNDLAGSEPLTFDLD